MTMPTSLRRGASAIAMGLALTAILPVAAMAQDADPAEAGADEEIVVSGFRASLESAVGAKKERDQIVESISAEDIGKLPDASIAESIARLPGLTSQRVSGRSNSISIRGFAPDFSTTLLNGREQTSTGDNRAVEYDQYPSEVINQVLVYKTPMASIVGQGLSGTVDLRTIRPLEYGKRVISIGARGSLADLGKLNAGSKKYGYRVNGVFVDQFANDTLGVALSASYVDEPYQIQEFNAWGYAGNGTAASPVVIGGSKSYATSTQLTRLGLQGTLQWQPHPNFTSTLDAFYSDFKDDQIKRGIELPLAFGGAGVNVTDIDDSGEFVFARAGTFTNVEGVVRNDVFERKAKLYSFGWNNRWEGDDGWNVTADISLSKTDRNELIFESNAGTGRGGGVGAVDTIGFRSDRNGTVFSPHHRGRAVAISRRSRTRARRLFPLGPVRRQLHRPLEEPRSRRSLCRACRQYRRADQRAGARTVPPGHHQPRISRARSGHQLRPARPACRWSLSAGAEPLWRRGRKGL
jgi:iron complex outermembrane receptor protein